MDKIDKTAINLEAIAKIYAEIESEMLAEKYCSQLHDPKWLTITKVDGIHNDKYKKGLVEYGMCKGIEVGKAVLLCNNHRWYRTSPVVEIDEENKTFKTYNSIYAYEWDV